MKMIRKCKINVGHYKVKIAPNSSTYEFMSTILHRIALVYYVYDRLTIVNRYYIFLPKLKIECYLLNMVLNSLLNLSALNPAR